MTNAIYGVFVTVIVAVLGSAAMAVNIETVPVGDAGNDADTHNPQPGAVDYEYGIGKYEVTNAQYVEFLNAVAVTDTYGLYNTDMGGAANLRGGIIRSGVSSEYTYAVRDTNWADKPVNSVSWYDTLRFANWLTNGQGSGSTESGSYTITGSGPNWTVTVPTAADRKTWSEGGEFHVMLTSRDEWYKAAYYKGGGATAGYWDLPTGVDAPTSTTVQATATGDGKLADGTTPVTSGNYANYNKIADWNGQDGNVTTVGTNGGASPYGTFDQGGNLWEWTEEIDDTKRRIRGGSFWNVYNYLYSSYLTGGLHLPTSEYYNLGFRVSQVPEPTTMTLLAIGGLAVLRRRRGSSSNRQTHALRGWIRFRSGRIG